MTQHVLVTYPKFQNASIHVKEAIIILHIIMYMKSQTIQSDTAVPATR